MKNILKISTLVVLILCSSASFGQDGFYFFTADDVNNMKHNAKTTWGSKIVEGLEVRIAERQKHELRVPLLEGGHLHDYFCPIHNAMFQFDWSNPNKHLCNACGKYWEGNNRFDWAWVNVLHGSNINYITESMYLYIISDDERYAENIRLMLLDYASKYPTYFEHNTNRKASSLHSGRMYGQSLDESVWASDAARAYSVIKKTLSDDDISKIERGYLRVAADMLLKRKGGGNWQVWHNSGLIALGVALEDEAIIDEALNDPKHGYHFLMSHHVYADGWWNEGSPIYHYYPLRAMLLSADALRCRGINLFDSKLYDMFASPAQGTYANLLFPAHNDGWYGESLLGQVPLYEVASQRYNDNILAGVLKEAYKNMERSSTEALLNKMDLTSPSIHFKWTPIEYKNLGVSILRSNEKTLVFKYGPYGGGHGHPDKLSISIHNGTKEILSDMGTSAYGVPDFTGWYRKTLSHNTVLVDGKDQKETTGELIHFSPNKKGGAVSAKILDAYQGVEMKRVLSLSGSKLSDVYTIKSDEEHTYDYVLIFTDKPQIKQHLSDYDLGYDGAYKRLSNVQGVEKIKAVKFSTATADLEINVEGADHFDLILGEAPGIPPRNPAIAEAHSLNLCYPLIIRMKGKQAEVKVNWLIH